MYIHVHTFIHSHTCTRYPSFTEVARGQIHNLHFFELVQCNVSVDETFIVALYKTSSTFFSNVSPFETLFVLIFCIAARIAIVFHFANVS